MGHDLLYGQAFSHQGDHLIELGDYKTTRPIDGQLPLDQILPGVGREMLSDANIGQLAAPPDQRQGLLGRLLAADAFKGNVHPVPVGPVCQSGWDVFTGWVEDQAGA